jgi:hypothetical protein
MRRMNAFLWTPGNTTREWQKCNDYSEIFYDAKTVRNKKKTPTLNHHETTI